ncbi:ribosomal protein L1 [Suhomyces tanzawaensis NRRL Y-17324]|uniref:Ribosomal protein L1 n=1 Tax=Suhomyces tanzawaensis NRRL Y-17324 TaxID=984487 RepID=A0A1E4SPW0_9ASCO|nr:ribosomal protein L1 [Suhomyces tanzawaensis NRRL Y-17324]ODV81554.1 ribosomal protein L1 [Suhomyces tanzawaensis NRRL Y-17324]
MATPKPSPSMLRPMFKLVRPATPQAFLTPSRLFSQSHIALKPNTKDTQKDSKRKLRKQQAIKAKNKQAPELHPLYMDVPGAMRYLRAAEVGQPAKKTTVSILMTVLPEKGSKPLQGSVYLPKPIKDNHVMIFSLQPEVVEQAKALGATYAGGLELIEEIKEGKAKLDNLTHAFATPDIVKDLKVIARQIGPKGLMPSAKKGTVSEDIPTLMKQSVGALPFKQKDQHLSIPIGRCDFSDVEIIENLRVASKAIYDSQPPGTRKPNIIGQTCLSSTMGPSLVINFRNF